MEKYKNIDECRDAIDNIDNEILALLCKRMDIVKRVGEIKNSSGSTIYVPKREDEILNRLKSINKNISLTNPAIEGIFLEIFSASRNAESSGRVLFLGSNGSFCHQAAKVKFGSTSDYVAMNNINVMFKEIENKNAKFGVIPIESSFSGSVYKSLDALEKSHLKVICEVYLPIEYNLCTYANTLKEIENIYAKDSYIEGCSDFLKSNLIEKLKFKSLDFNAIDRLKSNPNSAFILSNIASKIYNIPTLYKDIANSNLEIIRYFIVSDFNNATYNNSKTSFILNLDSNSNSGALFDFLRDFKEENINLMKMDSRLVKDKNSLKYKFFIDCKGDIKDCSLQKTLENKKYDITWLGSYVKGDYEL